jgi:hypothetical protein
MISVLKDVIRLKDNTGFVTCMHDNFRWLGFVLHPHGPSALYMYPTMPHILQLPESAVLAKLSPNIATERTYTLTSEETKLTAERSETNIHL